MTVYLSRTNRNQIGSTIGLAFKPNTDDMREAPSRVIIAELLKRGASIKAYDPKARAAARSVLPAVNELRLLKQPVIIDGRNLYEPALMESLGFEYVGIGRGASSSDANPWKLRRSSE